MCLKIIDSIEDINELRDMLSIYLPAGWDSLYLMSKYNISKLLKNEKVQLVIDWIWEGESGLLSLITVPIRLFLDFKERGKTSKKVELGKSLARYSEW